MEEKEVELRLRALQAKAREVLKLLALDRYTPEVSQEVERLARALKEELRTEEKAVSQWSMRDDLTLAEARIYYYSIVEAWVAISPLRVDGIANKAWYDKFDEVRYKLGKYLRSKPLSPE